MIKGCLDEGILQSYMDQELSDADMKSASLHLKECPNCQLAVESMKESDSWLLPILCLETKRILDEFKPLTLSLPDVRQDQHLVNLITAMATGFSLAAFLIAILMWTPMASIVNTWISPMAVNAILTQAWNLALTITIDSTFLAQLQSNLLNTASIWTVLFVLVFGWRMYEQQRILHRRFNLY